MCCAHSRTSACTDPAEVRVMLKPLVAVCYMVLSAWQLHADSTANDSSRMQLVLSVSFRPTASTMLVEWHSIYKDLFQRFYFAKCSCYMKYGNNDLFIL